MRFCLLGSHSDSGPPVYTALQGFRFTRVQERGGHKGRGAYELFASLLAALFAALFASLLATCQRLERVQPVERLQRRHLQQVERQQRAQCLELVRRRQEADLSHAGPAGG